MKRSLPVSVALAALLGAAAVGTATLTGCGGSSASYVQPGGSANQPNFAGRSYASAVTLANGQTGALLVSTNADGTATGTFTIDDGAPSRVVIATPLLSGTFDPVTGAFNLSGAYVFNGQNIPISITGTLPVPPSVTGGTITVTTGGESYTSTFTTGPLPTPGPTPTPGTSPSPSPSPSPTPTTSPSPGTGAFTFQLVSKSADCNFSDAGYANLPVKSAKLTGGASAGLYLFTGRLESGNTSFQISWQRLNATNGLVPEAFTFVPNPAIGAFGDEFQGILGTAAIIPIGSLSAGAWSPTGGRLIVESVSGQTVRVRGENVEFTPNRFNAISAKGTFIANFTATFDNVSGL